MKKQVSYSISDKLLDDFYVTSKIKNDRMSHVIERSIMDYITVNKAEVIEKLKNGYFKIDEIDEN